MPYILLHSDKSNKKYMIYHEGKKVYFGANGYEDYTIHHDDERKLRYIDRHQKNEKWNDPSTAGFWSRWLLWNKPTINESLSDIRKKFKLWIINKL